MIGVAEQRWNQACYQKVLDASPSGTIAYTREPAVDELLGLAPFSNLEKVLDYLRSEEPPKFIIKPAITAPTDLVEGLETTYETYKLKPETISFDLLWIQPHKDNTYSVSIIDIRLAETPSLAHRMELTYHMLALQRILEANGLTDRYSVSDIGYIWPGTHERDRFPSLFKEYQSTENPIAEAFKKMLVHVQTETYKRKVVELLTRRLPSVLETGFKNAQWNLDGACLGCDFFPICLGAARQEDDLSRIPFLSRSQVKVLRDNGIDRVSRLFELAEKNDSGLKEIFQTDYRLQIDEMRIRARMKALVSNTPIPVAEARTISMAERNDHRIYLTTGYDPSTGLSLGFGCSLDCLEPNIYLVERAEGMSLEFERAAYLEFATTLTQWMKKNEGENIQFYVWDNRVLSHIRRVVQRYYDDPILTGENNILNILFPPEGILHNPEVFEHQPVTVVDPVLKSLIGLPIEVAYSLYESANSFARVNHDRTFGAEEEFVSPYSDEIPLERMIELWYPMRYAAIASKMNLVQKRRTNQELLSKIERAFTEQLNALRYVVKELQTTYNDRLGERKSAPFTVEKTPDAPSKLSELLKFELLNIAAQASENKNIRSMSVDEREARFHSVRGLRLKNSADTEAVLAGYQQDNPDIKTDELYVFDCSPESTESRIKEGEFTLVLTNEDVRLNLDAPWYEHLGLSFASGAALLSGYDTNLTWYADKNLSAFLQMELVQLGRKDGVPYVIIRFPRPEILDFVLREVIINLYKPLVIDPIFIDFSSDKIKSVLGEIESAPSKTAHRFLLQPDTLQVSKSPTDPESLYKRVDSSLRYPFNDNQKEFFHQTFKQRISMLWGPPGTGKTTVLAGTVFGWIEYFMELKKPLHICVGAVTYAAIDTLLDALVELLQAWKQNNPQRKDEPINILRLRSIAAEKPTNKRIEDITDVSEVAGRLRNEKNTVVIVGSTWGQISKLEQYEDGSFDLLVLDEASQIPVAAAASYFMYVKKDGHIALAGDDHQLGPIRGYQVEDTRKGLFDCIYTYMKDTHGIIPLQLRTNYRTNREISAWPSKRFYEEKFDAHFPNRRLEFKHPIREKPADWPDELIWSDEYLKLLDPDNPVVVITYDHPGYTLSNAFEAQIVTALTVLYKQQLEKEDDPVDLKRFWEDQLGIVTPHRAQMAAIRNALFDHAHFPRTPDPIVDTVERFQGRERDCIISSYVVSDKDFVRSEEGFILDHRRFNVTLTRARKKFIMLVSDAIVRHLSEDNALSEEAAHLQLFVEEYCTTEIRSVELPFSEGKQQKSMHCTVRIKRYQA